MMILVFMVMFNQFWFLAFMVLSSSLYAWEDSSTYSCSAVVWHQSFIINRKFSDWLVFFKAIELFLSRPALKSHNLCVCEEAKSTTTVDAHLIGKGKG